MTAPETRRVLVTGASRGIGRACALGLARAGFDVGVGYRADAAAAESVAKEARELGRDARLLGFDVADRAAAAAALERDVAEAGPFWGVVLAAGVHADAAFPALTGEAWDRVLRTNLDGFYTVLRPLVMPLVRMHDGGRIVAISSVAGLVGNRGQVNYSASKAGLHGATKALALELARRAITVNCVAPGLIETKGWEVYSAEARAAYPRSNPMMRVGSPWDIAEACAYLSAASGQYITGETLTVDGGGQHWGETWTTSKPEYFGGEKE